MTHFSPLHIGTGKENYDFSASDLHSDTLLSALAAMRVQMGQTENLESFLSSFLLSSAFLFAFSRFRSFPGGVCLLSGDLCNPLFFRDHSLYIFLLNPGFLSHIVCISTYFSYLILP